MESAKSLVLYEAGQEVHHGFIPRVRHEPLGNLVLGILCNGLDVAALERLSEGLDQVVTDLAEVHLLGGVLAPVLLDELNDRLQLADQDAPLLGEGNGCLLVVLLATGQHQEVITFWLLQKTSGIHLRDFVTKNPGPGGRRRLGEVRKPDVVGGERNSLAATLAIDVVVDLGSGVVEAGHEASAPPLLGVAPDVNALVELRPANT